MKKNVKKINEFESMVCLIEGSWPYDLTYPDAYISQRDVATLNELKKSGLESQAQLLRAEIVSKELARLSWPEISIKQAASLVLRKWFGYEILSNRQRVDRINPAFSYEVCADYARSQFPSAYEIVDLIHPNDLRVKLPEELLQRITKVKKYYVFDALACLGHRYRYDKGLVLGLILCRTAENQFVHKYFYVGNFGYV